LGGEEAGGVDQAVEAHADMEGDVVADREMIDAGVRDPFEVARGRPVLAARTAHASEGPSTVMRTHAAAPARTAERIASSSREPVIVTTRTSGRDRTRHPMASEPPPPGR